MKRMLLPLAGLALLAAPATAQNPDAGVRAERAINRLDTDNDGRVSEAEWTTAGRKERGFTRGDANGDGFIDTAEMEAIVARAAQRRADPTDDAD